MESEVQAHSQNPQPHIENTFIVISALNDIETSINIEIFKSIVWFLCYVKQTKKENEIKVFGCITKLRYFS